MAREHPQVVVKIGRSLQGLPGQIADALGRDDDCKLNFEVVALEQGAFEGNAVSTNGTHFSKVGDEELRCLLCSIDGYRHVSPDFSPQRVSSCRKFQTVELKNSHLDCLTGQVGNRVRVQFVSSLGGAVSVLFRSGESEPVAMQACRRPILSCGRPQARGVVGSKTRPATIAKSSGHAAVEPWDMPLHCTDAGLAPGPRETYLPPGCAPVARHLGRRSLATLLRETRDRRPPLCGRGSAQRLVQSESMRAASQCDHLNAAGA